MSQDDRKSKAVPDAVVQLRTARERGWPGRGRWRPWFTDEAAHDKGAEEAIWTPAHVLDSAQTMFATFASGSETEPQIRKRTIEAAERIHTRALALVASVREQLENWPRIEDLAAERQILEGEVDATVKHLSQLKSLLNDVAQPAHTAEIRVPTLLGALSDFEYLVDRATYDILALHHQTIKSYARYYDLQQAQEEKQGLAKYATELREESKKYRLQLREAERLLSSLKS